MPDPNARILHVPNQLTFHYTGWLMGILLMVYNYPYKTGSYHPLYNQTNGGELITAHISSNDVHGNFTTSWWFQPI